MSADPLEVHLPFDADANLYAYVRGTPLKNIDPLGLDDEDPTAPSPAPAAGVSVPSGPAPGSPEAVAEARMYSKTQAVDILVESSAASGHGHLAALIETEGGAVYVSQHPRAEFTTPQLFNQALTGHSEPGYLVVTELYTEDVGQMMSRPMTMDEARTVALDGNSLGYDYTDSVTVRATVNETEQMMLNAETFKQEYDRGEREYNICYNNCADSVQDIIEDGTGVSLPMDWHPAPNEYFEKLSSGRASATPAEVDSSSESLSSSQ